MLSRAVLVSTKQQLPACSAWHSAGTRCIFSSRPPHRFFARSEQAWQNAGKLHIVPFCRGAATTRVLRDSAAPAATTPAATKEDSTNKDKKKDDDEDKPISWGKFFLYVGAGISALIFVYYFRKADYNVHQTEVLLLERFRTFPLYYPPEPKLGIVNGYLDGKGLPPDLVATFAEWFIMTDLQEAGGVVRDDVLELCKELGLDEDRVAAKDYLMRGDGQLEEHRRLTGAGLQESVALLGKLAFPEGGGECLVDEAKIELLRQKLPQKGPSVMDGAAAITRLSKRGSRTAASADSTGQSPEKVISTSIIDAAKAPSPVTVELDDASFDEAAEKRMEDARLARIEEGLMARLNRHGILSPAEEARLHNVREQRTKL